MTGAHLTKEYVAQPSVTRSSTERDAIAQRTPFPQTVDHGSIFFTGPIIIRVKSSTITRSPEIAPAIANQNIAHVRRFQLKLLPTREHHCARGLYHFGMALAKASRRAAAAASGPLLLTEVEPDCANPDVMPGRVYRPQHACVGIEHFAVTLALALITFARVGSSSTQY